MKTTRLKALAVLCTLTVSGTLTVAQQQPEPAPKAGGEERVYTGRVPTGWSKLGLNRSQKQEIYKIQTETKEKIADLERQIQEAKDQERKKLVAVLTAAQREKLKATALGVTDEKGADAKPAPKDEKDAAPAGGGGGE